MAWTLLHRQRSAPDLRVSGVRRPRARLLGAFLIALGLLGLASVHVASAAPDQQSAPVAAAERTLAPIGGTPVPTAPALIPPTATRTPTPLPTRTPTVQASFFNATEAPAQETAVAAVTRTTPVPYSAVDHIVATATGTAIVGQTAIPRATARAAATATVERVLAVQATSTLQAAIVAAEEVTRATATTVVAEEFARASAATVVPAEEAAINVLLTRMRLTGPADAQTLTPGNRVLPTPIPIRYAGVPASSREAGWVNDTTLWLGVPHRSQFDNSLYAPTNCGPTSLGMILEAYGLSGYPTDAIRGEVNRISGDFNPDNGTSLYSIATVAQRAGLYPIGLGKRWTIDDVRNSLKAGRPVITLTRYADLPGNSYYGGDINHYIVLTGLSGDHIIYNDAAYSQGKGRGLLISPEALQRAWANSTIPGHSVAFALNSAGDGLLSPSALARRAAWEQTSDDEATVPDEGELAMELQGLARAIVFDSAVVPESNGAFATGAGPSRFLVLSAQSDGSSSLSGTTLVLLGLLGYASLAVALVLPRLRRRLP